MTASPVGTSVQTPLSAASAADPRWQTRLQPARVAPNLRRAAFDGKNWYTNWAGFESPRSKNGDHDWFQIQTTLPSVQPEYYNDNHYVFSWVGFGGGEYGSGALAQAGMEVIDNGKYGGQGTINPFTEWTNSTCGTCMANQDSDFPVSEYDEVSTVLTFDGETNGLADAGGESHHDESNVSDAYFDDYTTHNITDVFLGSGKHFSDTTLEWTFEDAKYQNPCNNQTCVYNSSTSTRTLRSASTERPMT